MCSLSCCSFPAYPCFSALAPSLSLTPRISVLMVLVMVLIKKKKAQAQFCQVTTRAKTFHLRHFCAAQTQGDRQTCVIPSLSSSLLLPVYECVFFSYQCCIFNCYLVSFITLFPCLPFPIIMFTFDLPCPALVTVLLMKSFRKLIQKQNQKKKIADIYSYIGTVTGPPHTRLLLRNTLTNHPTLSEGWRHSGL